MCSFNVRSVTRMVSILVLLVFFFTLAGAVSPADALAYMTPALVGDEGSAQIGHSDNPTGDHRLLSILDVNGKYNRHTFIGGAGNDQGYATAVDQFGNLYVVGSSNSAWGAPLNAYGGGGYDAFVAKLAPDGTLLWHTFLGGVGDDYSRGAAVDGTGNLYVVGTSNGTWGVPLNAYSGGGFDAYAVKLAPDGTRLWHTFLGGTGVDIGRAAAVDGAGNLYAMGDSSAAWGSPLNAYVSNGDAFAVKLSPDGTRLWLTFLGGEGDDWGFGAVFDEGGSLYVVGYSGSTWGAPVNAYAGGYDGFAVKLSPGGTHLWHTFLGGAGWDWTTAAVVDGTGNLYVAGVSLATWGAPLSAYGGGDSDAYAAKLEPDGTRLWHTFLGGTGADEGYGAAVDDADNLYVAGFSSVSWGAPLKPYGGGPNDAFAARLDTDGARLWHTFLGGTGNDYGYAAVIDGVGNLHVVGYSPAWGTPLNSHSGGTDAFAAKLEGPAVGTPSPIAPSGGESNSIPVYLWGAAENADEYNLQVRNVSGELVLDAWFAAAEAGCIGDGTCAVTPLRGISPGSFTWQVIGKGGYGMGQWSSSMSFSYASPAPGQAGRTAPEDGATLSVAKPTFEWQHAIGATYYMIQVNNTAGVKLYRNWYSAVAAGCYDDGVCSATPANALVNGNYNWWVGTWNPSGYGPWSTKGIFTISGSTPGQAIRIIPEDGSTLETATPTFEWEPVVGAEQYAVQVNDPAGRIYRNWYTADQCGCGMNPGADVLACSITPANTLPDERYDWWIGTWNSFGFGAWSTKGDFSVGVP